MVGQKETNSSLLIKGRYCIYCELQHWSNIFYGWRISLSEHSVQLHLTYLIMNIRRRFSKLWSTGRWRTVRGTVVWELPLLFTLSVNHIKMKLLCIINVDFCVTHKWLFWYLALYSKGGSAVGKCYQLLGDFKRAHERETHCNVTSTVSNDKHLNMWMMICPLTWYKVLTSLLTWQFYIIRLIECLM